MSLFNLVQDMIEELSIRKVEKTDNLTRPQAREKCLIWIAESLKVSRKDVSDAYWDDRLRDNAETETLIQIAHLLVPYCKEKSRLTLVLAAITQGTVCSIDRIDVLTTKVERFETTREPRASFLVTPKSVVVDINRKSTYISHDQFPTWFAAFSTTLRAA